MGRTQLRLPNCLQGIVVSVTWVGREHHGRGDGDHERR